MKTLLGLAKAIDGMNQWIGRIISWLALSMIAIGAYNAVVRKLGSYFRLNLSSGVYLELQWHMFSLLFLLGAAYTLSRNAHVRVDVVYSRLSPRLRAWIDLLGSLLFLIPFSLFALWVSWPYVRNSWSVWEMSPDPGGLPFYPIKTMILVAFVLLILQAVAEAIQRWAFLKGTGELAPGSPGEAEHQTREIRL